MRDWLKGLDEKNIFLRSLIFAGCFFRNAKLGLKTLLGIYSPVERVQIENTTICNANCKMCPRDSMARKKETMSMDMFRTIIDRCSEEGIKCFGMGSFGEPLIDPDFKEKVDYALSLGLSPETVTTNASLLNEELADHILDNFMHIGISLDGFSKEVYEKVDRGLNRDVSYNNVERLLKMRQEKNSKTRITINSVVFKDNYHEKDELLDYFKKRLKKGDVVAFLYAHNWGNSVQIEPAPGIRDLRYRISCGRLWSTLISVAVDGRYGLCCMDHNLKTDLGNVKDLGITDYWHKSSNLKRIRYWHLKGRFDKIDICRNCNYNYFIKQGYEVFDM